MSLSAIQNTMLVDHSLQHIIAQRAEDLGLESSPWFAIHPLGYVSLEGKDTEVFMRHAVDAIVIDHQGNVLLIRRKNHPGQGKIALPGGFIDPQKTGRAEETVVAVLRELKEETHLDLPSSIKPEVLGPRNFYRPYDIRQAYKDMKDVGISKGDLFLVSTQSFAFVVDDLKSFDIKSGDDASEVMIRNGFDLRPQEMAIDDHLDNIHLALRLLAPTQPRETPKTGKPNTAQPNNS